MNALYDITNSETFENVQSWLKEIDRNAGENCRKLLVGNKSDMMDRREVSYEQGSAFAKQLNMPFLETSAKSNLFILQAFETMAGEIKTQVAKEGTLSKNTENIKLGDGVGIESEGKKGGKCCE